MVWKHRGFTAAFAEAEERLRAAASANRRDLEEYRQALDRALNPIAEQIVENPHDSNLANVVKLNRSLPHPRYAAYTEFDGWLVIYDVIGDTTHIQVITQVQDGRLLDGTY